MASTHSGRASWVIGLVDGVLLGFLALIFFIPGLIGLALVAALTFVAFRSLQLVSGMLVGAGGVVGALLFRQSILICNEPDRVACPPGGLAIATAYGIALLLLGVLLGAVSMRKAASMPNPPTTD